VAQYGERVKPVKLEVRDEAAAKAAVAVGSEYIRAPDVLVNNAGYGQFAPFEQMSAEDFQAIVDTCFTVVYATRAAVPVMCKQKSGHIFQVSSVGGPSRGSGQYAVSRGQVGGGRFQRLAGDGSRALRSQVCTLSREVFGPTGHGAPVRMRRTCCRSMKPRVGSFLKILRGSKGVWKALRERSRAVILQLANSHEVPIRLILGVDAEKRVRQAEAARAAEADKWRHLTVSTVFEDGRFDSRSHTQRAESIPELLNPERNTIMKYRLLARADYGSLKCR